MKKNFLLTVNILFIAFLSYTSLVIADESYSNSKKLIGKVNWTEWKIYSNWDLTQNYIDYQPDTNKVKKINNLLKNINIDSIKIVIFATTTCYECMENLPKLFKILENTNIPESNIELYGLDEKLQEPSGYYKEYEIDTTPVVFLKYNNKLVAEISYPYIWLDQFIEILETLE